MTQPNIVRLHTTPRFIPTIVILVVQSLLIFGVFSCGYYLILPKLLPKKTGYICDDPSLKYTYKDNTIDIAVVHSFSLVIVAMAFLIECEPHQCFKTRKITTTDSEIGLNNRIFRFLHIVLGLAFGAVANYILYQIVKFAFTRHRPHFFDVCRPDAEQCRPGDYVERYECRGTNMKTIKDAHLSFYSGHASTAFYYATFAAIYLHLRLVKKNLNCLPWLFMFSCLWYAGAMYVAGSRVQDNKHHFVDVVVGSVVGLALGLGMVLVYVRQSVLRFSKPERNYIATESDLTPP
ncbi:unnamed protein product [Bursaphelenchus okinawaensis]|uniref:Phosphatidic acid phosphatase type 2/haloperoxidase domain-containing protein n=1 Tax=Bursaphelenchus okinawaensis TaxID=465554 RepID=A0A811K4D7_9BILA|nr:unnamed protein product [Bursaphelenchus okinawaensis]CAG9092175.1 unnamed protein product [Bursaphelenchus okinawaensis]